MKLRLALALPLLMLWAGGCPPADNGGNPGDIAGMTVEATAPTSAGRGDLVSLSARVIDGPGEVTYQWYQTYGRAVELSSNLGPIVTFDAPSLPSTQELRFRVDSTVRGQTFSDEVTIVIAEDPSYGFEPGSGDGGGGGDSDPAPVVRLVTSKGTMVVELNRTKAPVSVRNFLRYVDEGFYNGTVFHRVIADFVIQGGGFDQELAEKETHEPIINEASNGLKNVRGTIAMARLPDPDSATSQFYFNLIDNDSLNKTDNLPGYAVFGRITEGLSVMDAIGAVETGDKNGMSDVPIDNVVLTRVERVTAGK